MGPRKKKSRRFTIDHSVVCTTCEADVFWEDTNGYYCGRHTQIYGSWTGPLCIWCQWEWVLDTGDKELIKDIRRMRREWVRKGQMHIMKDVSIDTQFLQHTKTQYGMKRAVVFVKEGEDNE